MLKCVEFIVHHENSTGDHIAPNRGEVLAAAPPDLQENMNRLVTVALREVVARRKNTRFRQAIAEMAADPAIQAENTAIAREFAVADKDGLPYDQTR